MIKAIIHDPMLLCHKAEIATIEDKSVAVDLLDTLSAHREECVGMAANMIGINKRIIVFNDCGAFKVMFNPEIIKKTDGYEASEGCLSLAGVRTAKRYKTIRVQYQTEEFKMRTKVFTGWVAQIIQHEIDHLNGILI